MTTKTQFQDDSISLTSEQCTMPKIIITRRSLMHNFGSSVQKPILRKTAQSCPAMSPQKSKRILSKVLSKCSIKTSQDPKLKNSNPMKNLKRKLSCSIQNVKYATRRSKSAKITSMKEINDSDVFCGESSKRRSIESRNRILSVKEEEIEDVIIWEETFIPKKKRSRMSFLRR